MKIVFINFVWLSLIISVYSQNNGYDNTKILCTDSFCETYRITPGCPALPEECLIQNSTHNGLYVLYPGPCNCCKYCLRNLGENEDCVVGSLDGPVPEIICGDGLYCDSTSGKCVPSPGKCTQSQTQYDNRRKSGMLGHMELRAKCDRRGYYQGVQCLPGEICYCVDDNGNRIFGDMPYSMHASEITKCGCSRNNNKVNDVLIDKKHVKKAKCLPNGNYDKLQCIEKNCICVNHVDGSPSEPKQPPTNIHLIDQMSCYNETIHSDYTKPCEKEYLEILEETNLLKEEGFNNIAGYSLPFCDLDGTYAPVQFNETQKYCVDANGEILDNYILLQTDPLAGNMNCNCARSQSKIQHFEKPSCCSNGNYKKMQCRRGKCRCVNRNGIQEGQEKDFENRKDLSCYCQSENENCCT